MPFFSPKEGRILVKLVLRITLVWLASNVAPAQDPNSIFFTPSPDADRIAAQVGKPDANIRLGYRALIGLGGPAQADQAERYFQAAVERHSPAASAWLGFTYATALKARGRVGEGIAMVSQASNDGDPVGMTLLGRIYQMGILTKDDAKSEVLYQRASQFALAKTYLAEMYVTTPDLKQQIAAYQLFDSAASSGETESMIRLAAMYLTGRITPKAPERAAYWLERAEMKGSTVAVYQRGVLYKNGIGLSRSLPAAASLFLRAATLGYPPAQAALGLCYWQGSGVQKDVGQALKWLTLAASTDRFAARQLAALKQQLAQGEGDL